jgi:hypothetical protein
MEDVRKHSDIRLACSERRVKKLVATPAYKRHVIFHKGLVGVECVKKDVKLNKPIYAGFSVLDISKTLMYEFHYEYIVPKYGTNAQLLFTDTDSVCYSIHTDDLYHDMKGNPQFDFSDYPTTSTLHSNVNKKVIGKFKDECCGKVAVEFVGLRAKMYSLLLDDNSTKATAKGIPRFIQQKHEAYKNCLFDSETTRVNFTCIRSKKHQVTTSSVTKKSLCNFDDKRYTWIRLVLGLSHIYKFINS